MSLGGDVRTTLAAAGTRGELIAGGAGGFGLAVKADVLWVGTATDGVDGPAGRLAATAATVTRVRTGLEGSRGYTLAGRLSLTPRVEVGYGLPVGHRFVGTPRVSVRTSAGGRDVRLGYRLGMLDRARLHVELGIEALHQERALRAGAEGGTAAWQIPVRVLGSCWGSVYASFCIGVTSPLPPRQRASNSLKHRAGSGQSDPAPSYTLPKFLQPERSSGHTTSTDNDHVVRVMREGGSARAG